MSSSETGKKCAALRRRFYTDEQRPGAIHRETVRDAGGPAQTLLEIGCGRDGNELPRYRQHYGHIVGIDPEVVPPGTDGEGWSLLPGDVHRLQFDDASFDTIAMRDVAEHLEDPVGAFRECARVLRPGGKLIILTVNLLFPPIFLARPLPLRWRQWLNRMMTGTADEDTFPAVYRANTESSIRTVAKQAGLVVHEFRHVSYPPGYLAFSVPAYRLGLWAARIDRRFEFLRHLRHYLCCVLIRPVAKPGVATDARPSACSRTPSAPASPHPMPAGPGADSSRS